MFIGLCRRASLAADYDTLGRFRKYHVYTVQAVNRIGDMIAPTAGTYCLFENADHRPYQNPESKQLYTNAGP
jgi:hypothetical protein